MAVMPVRTSAGPRGGAARRNLSPLLAAGLLLAGCASTRSSDLASAKPRAGQVPTHIVIRVTEAVPATDQPDQEHLTPEERTAFAKALKAQLDQRMRWPSDGVTIAEAATPRPPVPDTLVLQCTVTQLQAGSQAWRLTVGFGAGRAKLGVATQLVDLRGLTPVELASFRTSSTTGSMPGPGLGLVGAAASASAVGLAGGSAGVFMGSRQTIDRELVQSSEEIVTQLQTYFTDIGWPGFPPPVRSALASAIDPPPPRPIVAFSQPARSE